MPDFSTAFSTGITICSASGSRSASVGQRRVSLQIELPDGVDPHPPARATSSWATCGSRPGSRHGPALQTVALDHAAHLHRARRLRPRRGRRRPGRRPFGRRSRRRSLRGQSRPGLHPDARRSRPTSARPSSRPARGSRWRFWGRQSLYANLFYHSPYYHDTTLPALDRRDLSLDFGWILATRSGREWRIGLTEDLEPSGPGDRSHVPAGRGPADGQVPT